jgi:hypothetical protein
MLVRLLYTSRASDEIDDGLLQSILDRSRSHNLEHGITGVLCVYPEGGVFLQALEGAREAVNALYGKIVSDPRHRDVTLLHYAEVEERSFAAWQMGCVDLKKINLSTILRYSEKPVLDPFSMTGRGALALLEELVTTAAIVSRDLVAKS